MQLATILLATYVSADSLDNQLTTVDSVFGISASSITSVLMEYMGTIVEYLFEMFDLKMRTIRFLVSLYTDENLHLFKRLVIDVLKYFSISVPKVKTFFFTN